MMLIFTFKMHLLLPIAHDRTAKAKFGRSYQQLTAQQREQLRTLCPQRVAETYGTAQKGGSK